MNLKTLTRQAVTLSALLTGVVISMPLMADTLELSDGTVLEGDFVGSSNGIVMFNTGDNIEAYPEDQVVGIFLSSGVANAASASEAQSPILTIPAGTPLLLRTVETIDSNRHGAGHRFRAQLESALVVNGSTAAPRGAFVYGVISGASRAGNVGGSTNLSLEFTGIMIDDQLYPMVTTEVRAQSENEAARTVQRSARAAAIGALVDGRSGARRGAKIGAGVSLLTAGASINVPRGTILETTLRTPVVIQ